MVSLLPRLRRRQRALVIGRFGLFDHPEQTLAELAARELLSVERTRRIVGLALCKLRWWARLMELRASTSKRQPFWDRWSATEHLRPRGADGEL